MLYVRETTGTVDDVVKKLEDASLAYQFGVLGIHDLKQKMNAKGVPFDSECRVLEVCNPSKAKKVLDSNMAISTALPCRISVFEEGDKIKVATLNPTAMLAMFNEPELNSVASEVEETVKSIIDAVCD